MNFLKNNWINIYVVITTIFYVGWRAFVFVNR